MEALRRMPDDSSGGFRRRATLEAFERALEREAHNLRERPDLFWQQLHNRLQREKPVPQVLAPQRCPRLNAPATYALFPPRH